MHTYLGYCFMLFDDLAFLMRVGHNHCRLVVALTPWLSQSVDVHTT